MNAVLFEMVIIAVLLMLNAIFSMSEMAIVSSRKARLRLLADTGNKGAGEAIRLVESPNRFLSTVQIGITLVGVLSGAFGGLTISKEIGLYFVSLFSWSAELAHGIGMAIVVSIITFLSVLLGELVPKRLALKYPEKIASFTARPMSLISRISAPVVLLLSSATDLVLKIFCLDHAANDANVTHEEIKAMVEQGAQEGGIGEQEVMMIDRVLSFGKKRVTSFMTQTRDIVWIDALKPLDAQLEKVLDSQFSQFPVVRGGLDYLQGTLQAKDICRLLVERKKDFSPFLYQPLYIPESSHALQTFELFKRTGLQMGFVIDEFGGIQGLLTLTNILEAIVGDMPSYGVATEVPVVRRGDGSWLIAGALPIGTLKESLGIAQIEGEGTNIFRTVAGFVMHQLGRIPVKADSFVWHDWRFEIVEMDRNRVNKILVSNLSVRFQRQLDFSRNKSV